ncbi:SDR family oxidoreductase [uncultured Fusobacterium sp.]|uniref:SDR family oxidoreductase n=1 Tax=uncultured Fusobacterium sp. TaxID=159267 RepID=UPI0025843FCE|nr:SDR family oxidoreductase [uncultured Fusobacterium sp.]
MNNCIEFPKGTSFLVTGGAGFIGSNIVEKILYLGHKVKVLDNFSTGKRENIAEFLKKSNFELIEGDIRDINTCRTACKDVDYVIHQAAWGSVPRSIEMPVLYDDINVKGHLNMMQAARENNVKKFVYASSSAVYGDDPILPKQEGSEGKVISPYALTKRINEEYADLYYRLYGLETVGLRYFNVFGKRQDPNGAYAAVIPKFVKELLGGIQPVIYGDGETSRDFIFIDNVVEANLKACIATSEASGKAFNIGYGQKTSLNDLYKKLSELLEKIDISPRYEKEREGDIKHSTASIEKAKEILKYNPQYSVNEGLELTIDWYKNNL